MPDPTFFPAPAPLNLAEIVALTGARLASGGRPDVAISGVSALDAAGPHDIAFIDNVDYARDLERTGAGACLCLPRFTDKVPPTAVALETKEPARAFALLAARLFPAALRPIPIIGGNAISTDARIDATARLEEGVRVGPFAVIGAGAEIGSGTLIGPGAIVGPHTRIGRDCSIGPGASVMHALVGNRVIIHPGARIGQDGFGFIPGANGHLKVPQVGRVVIQDDVEIGANTAIDRGSVRDTFIGEGSKIDNLVQIGHNVVVGRYCFLAGMVGVSGSVTIGDYAALGGNVGIAPHISIGPGASIAAKSGVFNDIPAGARWGGYPARPADEWLRAHAAVRRASRLGGAGKKSGAVGKKPRSAAGTGKGT